jgi:hypothetical protein
MTASDVAPGTRDTSSTSSLKSESSSHETAEHSICTFVPDHEDSSTPEDQKEKILEALQDNWETDPENARNWPAHQRWGAMLIVRRIVCGSFLTHQRP